jgi:hypothetical protein
VCFSMRKIVQCARVDTQGSTADCRSAHRHSRCRRGLAHQQDERRMQAFAFTDGVRQRQLLLQGKVWP